MSLPRELFIREGRLCQRPVREIETLWKDSVCLKGQRIEGERRFEGVCGRAFDMTLEIVPEEGLRSFAVRFAQDASAFTQITYDHDRQEITFDRTCSGSRRDIAHVRRICAPVKNGGLELRLIVDGESAELFAGGGERVLSCLIETPVQAQGISFLADGCAAADIEMHTLGR